MRDQHPPAGAKLFAEPTIGKAPIMGDGIAFAVDSLGAIGAGRRLPRW